MTIALTPERFDELLDPGIAPAVRQLVAAAAKVPPSHLQTPEQVRAAWEGARKPLVRGPHALQISDKTLDTVPAPLDVRLYRPASDHGAQLPAVVYFHGGGFTNGDLDSQDAMCCALAEQGACLVMSVDYRKLPKHHFPAAFDDAVAAVRWLAAHAGELQVDASRIGVAGDSSGANLALAAAMALRGELALKAMWLAYPIVGTDFDTESYLANAHAPLLTRERCKTILRNYLGKDVSGADWRAAPLLATDFSGLPAAVVIAAELDPLRSEAEILARRLQQADGQTVCINAKGMTHAFLRWADVPGAAQTYVQESVDAMRGLLAR